MASVTVVSTASSFPLIRLPKIRRSPGACSIVFLLCDAVSITGTAAVAVAGTIVFGGYHGIHRYLVLWPALGVFFAMFASANLYPGIIHNAVSELRRLASALTMGFVLVAALIFSAKKDSYQAPVFCFWWATALLVTPLLRSFVRKLLSNKPWWGIPVAVFYTGEESGRLIRELEKHRDMGLRPVVVLSGSAVPRNVCGLPILDVQFSAAIRACGVERAVIALPDAANRKLLEELEVFESSFPRLMILQSSAALYSLTVDVRQIGGSLAFEVRKDLLLLLPRVTKRAIDLTVVGVALPMVTFLVLLLGLLVRLESPGPVFYGHRRIGRNRSSFITWKIRSMKVNSDELLRKSLAEDESLREEWSRNRKLRRDPRITRVGRFLRRSSLDELPQLWNVLLGEMSLVGPRPIVEDEVAAYGQHFGLYCRVTPGLTGLWQVSGRNAVSTSDRVRLDSYYVRNWSPWLDLYILARTARVVFTGQGAY
jgi:Undecaprenyl-phosphate galactose phosphotransferase WbaP